MTLLVSKFEILDIDVNDVQTENKNFIFVHFEKSTEYKDLHS